MHDNSVSGLTDLDKPVWGLFLPLQLFLLKLQLQHDSTQLHVQIVSSLQFPLVVLTNIQSMSERKNTVIKTLPTDSKHRSGGQTLTRPRIYERIYNRVA